MRVFLLLLIGGMFFAVAPGYASDAVGTTAVEVKQTQENGLDQMKKAMLDDQKTQQDVYRIKGEIEKTKLEIEKQKMLRELAQLTGSETAGGVIQGGPDAKLSLVIKNIFCSDKIKEAVVDVGGREAVLKEGSSFQGAIVKQIDPQGVVFTREGKDERIEMRK